MFLITENPYADGQRRMRAHRDLALEAERLDFEEKQKREKTRPPKHNKLRGPYGQRK
ncbi:hypothetical protein V0M98_32400 (plasmid) [Pseudomonas silesiensis]|uniref:hypothetical protein n=1 Tax=Pseudomonas silesiensis TaxID=1853130 RepID=UPI0030D271F5